MPLIWHNYTAATVKNMGVFMRSKTEILKDFQEKNNVSTTTVDMLKKIYVEALSTGECTVSELSTLSMALTQKNNGKVVVLTQKENDQIARTITSKKPNLFQNTAAPLLQTQSPTSPAKTQGCPCAAM